jgi:cytochrome P450
VGCLLDFRRRPLPFLEEAARYGKVVYYRFGPVPVLQLNAPAAIDHVLVAAAKSMHKDDVTSRLSTLLGNGLVTSEGEVWKKHRKIAAPSFAHKAIEGYAAEMVACTNRWIDRVADGEIRDVHHDMMGVTHEIVLRTLLGAREVRPDEEGVGQSIAAWMDEFQTEAQGWRRMLPTWIPTPGRRVMRNAVARIDAEVYAIIAERRANPGGSDVLSRLLAARDDDGQPLSDLQLRDETVTFFLAGHETTALALTYAIDLLARHPEAARKLTDEVRARGQLGAADAAALPWTTAVIQEAMRVHPPVWAIGRSAQEATEVLGWPVHEGDELFVPQWVVHRNPELFPDPEAFRPERWLDGLERRLPRSAYFPFGGGPRVCIGNHFAMLEAVLVLASIAQRLDLELVDPAPLSFVPTVTLRPSGPVRMRIRRRAAA